MAFFLLFSGLAIERTRTFGCCIGISGNKGENGSAEEGADKSLLERYCYVRWAKHVSRVQIVCESKQQTLSCVTHVVLKWVTVPPLFEVTIECVSMYSSNQREINVRSAHNLISCN